jgi:hypothetical protein
MDCCSRRITAAGRRANMAGIRQKLASTPTSAACSTIRRSTRPIVSPMADTTPVCAPDPMLRNSYTLWLEHVVSKYDGSELYWLMSSNHRLACCQYARRSPADLAPSRSAADGDRQRRERPRGHHGAGGPAADAEGAVARRSHGDARRLGADDRLGFGLLPLNAFSAACGLI